MVGITVRRNPNGITLHKTQFDGIVKPITLELDQDECNKIARTIWEARRKYWKDDESMRR